MNETQRQEIQELLDAPTLYPEKPRKSLEQRRADLEHWLETYGEVNVCYNFHGLDLEENTDIDAYLDRCAFRKDRYQLNSKFYPQGSSLPFNPTIITRDKKLFECFAAYATKDPRRYPVSLGMIADDGKFFGWQDPTFQALVERLEGQRVVFKQTYGCSGTGVMVVSIAEGKITHDGTSFTPQEFLNKISQTAVSWLIQGYIIQHPWMASLNPSSVNTMRIVTFNTGARVVNSPAILCYGKEGCVTDNADSDGFCAEVSPEGIVGPYAFNFMSKYRTDCPVVGQQVPFYTETVEFLKRLHSFIPELFTVGWDVTVTPDGPLVIEGNDGWDPYVTQTPLGNAMRAFWNDMVQERKDFYGWD